ncbi:hypothetical protein [Methylobacterium fujisawaense]|uniref:hypothetical protein n=1 Tax=Methylobacterium fujisawaense TaxID=107400 RepID=UPI002F35390D
MSRDLDILSRAVSPEPKIPAHLLTDPVARAWLEVFEARSLTRGWDHGDVDFLLKEAFTLLRRLGGRVGPKRDAGFWPPICRDLRDGDTLNDRATGKVGAEQVTRMELVLDWLRPGPRAFLPLDTDERNALMLWCWCIEHGQKFTDAVADLAPLGVKKATIDRHRRRASMMIATRLILEGASIPPVAMRARETRARSDMHGDLPAVDLPVSVDLLDVPELASFWALAEVLAQAADPVERADAVQAAIYDRVRWEHRGVGFTQAATAERDTRRRKLEAAAIARGLLDPKGRADALRGRTERGRMPYRYEVGTAVVSVSQTGGRYGREAAWRTHLYEYAIEGGARDVEAARDELLGQFPPAAYRTSFTPLEPVEPGRVRTAGWRAATAD